MCDCGVERKILLAHLKNGSTKGCRECSKSKVEEHFFDKIDNSEKAYILGFLYADGCNYENEGKIKIDIAEQDVDILHKIKKCMKYDGNILRYNQNIDKICGVSCKSQPTYRINIHSKHLSKQLSDKGCHGNKTYNLSFPSEYQVPSKYLCHFIRGLLDGDGCISSWVDNKQTGHKKFSVTLTGTTELVGVVAEKIKAKFNCTPCINTRYPDRDNNNITMNICGNALIEKILTWLYQGASLYMDRKYEKYLELLDERNRILSKTINDLPSSCFPPRTVRDLRTGKTYESTAAAAKDIGISASTVSWQCRKAKNNYLEYIDNIHDDAFVNGTEGVV